MLQEKKSRSARETKKLPEGNTVRTIVVALFSTGIGHTPFKSRLYIVFCGCLSMLQC